MSVECSMTVPHIISTLNDQYDRLKRGLIPDSQIMLLPRVNSSLDKKTQIARKSALELFSPDVKEPNTIQRTHAYIQFNKRLGALKHKYKDHQDQLMVTEKARQYKTDRFRRVRVCGDEKLWLEMLDEPAGRPVLVPEPMPVMVPPLDEFKPFFCHMKAKAARPSDQVEFKRGVFYADGRIDMCKQVVGPQWIGKLMEAITNNTKVEHFLLGNNIIDLKGAQAIAAFIEAYRQPIKTWYLAGNRIGAEGVKLIAAALCEDVHADALWLKRNPLMSQGVKYLADMLMTNKSIEILDLDNTGLMDEGCEYLFEKLVHNTTLKVLYIDANNIGLRGAVAIKTYFQTMATQGRVGITSLFMGMNPLKDQGIQEIAQGLLAYHHMERFCVNSARMTSVGLNDLLEALVSQPKLIVLDVGHYKATADMHELPNYLGLAGAQLLSAFIRRASLKILDCRTCHLPLQGLKAVADAVEESKTLLYVYPEQFGLRSAESRQQLKRIRETCDVNCQGLLNLSLQDFLHQDHLRFMKHTSKVKYIDSIYRNNM